jgi:hypothetical protein
MLHACMVYAQAVEGKHAVLKSDRAGMALSPVSNGNPFLYTLNRLVHTEVEQSKTICKEIRALRVTECAYQWHSGSAAQAPGPGQPEPQALAQTSGMKLGPGGRHARSAIQAGSLDSAPKADVPLARLWPATQWHSQPDSGSPSRSWHSRTPVAGSRR